MSVRRECNPDDTSGFWHGEMKSLLAAFHGDGVDRREFLCRITALLTYARAAPVFATTNRSRESATNDGDLTEEPWLTLAAVQDHLFPATDDGPGAGEINAASYLKAALAEPDMDPDYRELIKNGISWLNEISNQYYQADFSRLDEDSREEVLRRIEKTPTGKRWLSLLLLYTFEALLSDPVYGGNPGGIGWKWLEHQPGFPRPPADQRYQDLKKI